MKRGPIAVIDIGSNTIRSLIVEILPRGGYRILDDEREAARLASGLDRNGRLSASAITRAVRALRRMAEIAGARGAREVAVVATSAIRNAHNRREFLSRVARETGLRVRVISGTEEAQLAFESAALSFDLQNRLCAVADVGGGSTEIILALGHHVQHLHSLQLGTVALTEQYLHTDPVKRREFKALRTEIRRRLAVARVAAEPSPQFLIASGGTASAIAQISMALQGMPGRPVQGFEITRADLRHLRDALLARTLAERRQIPGLSAERADIILAGVAILYETMAHLRVNVLRVSARGIRHALLNRLIARNSRAHAASLSRPRRLAAAESFARSLRFEQRHGEHVQKIALSIFDQVARPLGLPDAARDLLAAAALLHDVGYVVSFRQHHKHAYHLIAHAQLDGFTPDEREIIALVARYHRRSAPSKRHAAWASLAREDRSLVRRLSALMRVADALDRRHTQAVQIVRCGVSRGRLRLCLTSNRDPAVEIHAAEEKADLFREVFGLQPVFSVQRTARQARSIRARAAPSAARRARLTNVRFGRRWPAS